eukprot:CAMPEP_0114691778 /NCGR_PEP_ID=MMETSP0191-20121206/67205_1 /TAXON_ID=126664 /ORGANISM="Sorites sp." /LENGTH=119 /DNA_ID=CAMNT_0001983375 /DNA_START=324 /DNA_END=683 /DNA_ORIENTATION=+
MDSRTGRLSATHHGQQPQEVEETLEARHDAQHEEAIHGHVLAAIKDHIHHNGAHDGKDDSCKSISTENFSASLKRQENDHHIPTINMEALDHFRYQLWTPICDGYQHQGTTALSKHGRA